MPANNLIHLDVDRIKKATNKAFLVEIDWKGYWLPMSQVAAPEAYEEGDEGCDMSVNEWFAKQKGLA